MNDKTEITSEALLRRAMLHGVTAKAQVTVIAAAALHIREGLDNLAKEINRMAPPKG